VYFVNGIIFLLRYRNYRYLPESGRIRSQGLTRGTGAAHGGPLLWSRVACTARFRALDKPLFISRNRCTKQPHRPSFACGAIRVVAAGFSRPGALGV
jgi:hypothetical protein